MYNQLDSSSLQDLIGLPGSAEMGAMVGMAVADSVGAFLEFLPVGKKASDRSGDEYGWKQII